MIEKEDFLQKFYRGTLTISKHVLKWIRSAEKVSENIEGIPEDETLESELVEIVCVVILAAGMTWTCWWTVGFETFNAELIVYFALFFCNWIKITITSKMIFLDLPGIPTLTGYLAWLRIRNFELHASRFKNYLRKYNEMFYLPSDRTS